MKSKSAIGWVLLVTLAFFAQASCCWAQEAQVAHPPALPAAHGPTVHGIIAEPTADLRVPEASVADAPIIFCPEPTKNFGVLYVSEEWKHSFVVTNQGTADLVINSVQKDCGCTEAKADAMRIAPGDSTKVNVVFNSGQHPTKTKKKVTLLTNDPLTPKASLEFVGEVTSAFRFSPPTFPQFGSLPKGATSERSIDIIVTAKEPIELLDAKGSSPLIRTTLAKVAEAPEPTYRLTALLEIPDDYAERFIRDDILIGTTFERENTIRFSVYAGIEPEVSISPSFMNFHSVQKSQYPSRSVYIQSRRGQVFEITDIEHNLDGFEIETVKEDTGDQGGTRYKITAKMTDAFNKEGFFRDQMLIRTTLKTQSEIQIFVYGSLLTQPGAPAQPQSPHVVPAPPARDNAPQGVQHPE